MFLKLGEATFIDVENTDSVINDPKFNTSHSSQILSKFAQFTQNLKRIAPKANDFLYFSAVMMHAAEAASLNEDGSLKALANGEPIKVGWEKKGDTWKWSSNDPSLKPYRNNNRDIFPEEELLKAYKKWVGKPLCIDHKSSSVDHVRGFIVDTYYDRNLKRVIALCALDKKNYPDLAHKVSTGYSNNVSMGTAVGQAICSDCGKVAKAEPDFCQHMRNKTCYGEINIDLSPIELSIVVNGADPRAKIKHIIAAANSLNNYINNKESELKKIAEVMLNAKFNFSGSSEDETQKFNQSQDRSVSSTDWSTFENQVKEELTKLKSEYDKLVADEEAQLQSEKDRSMNDSNDAAYNQSSGHMAKAESEINSNNPIATPGSAKFASEQDTLVQQLKEITASIEQKFNHLKQDFNQLTTKLQHHKEETMSVNRNFSKSAYYQGAGGVNEPTPGKTKYAPDPLNEKDRNEEDKQMHPVDTGDVDGLFPGDLDRKKLLARAEAEERAIRRQAAVQLAKEALERRKQAYFQGGGDVNEPTPGKTKYAPDPLALKLRELDKHMVGQKPFPDVGNVDDLHPSPESVKEKDEAKRKEMLRRAGFKAQFVKAANDDGSLNVGDSRWNVFMGDKLVLTASVNDIAGRNADLMFDSIATKDFGSKLIQKVKTSGASTVKSMLKRAQAVPPAPAAPPAAAPAMDPMMGGAPGGAPGMDPMMGGAPGAEGAEGMEDPGKEGDPAQNAMSLAVKIRDLGSDLVEALRALTGEKAEMGALEGLTGAPGGASAPGAEGASAGGLAGMSAPPAKAASAELRTLTTMRKELNGALISAMKEAIAELKDHREELEMIANVYNSDSVNHSNANYVASLVQDAFADAKTAIADSTKLMTAFVKYARGTEAMIKRAESEAKMYKMARSLADEGLDLSEEGDSDALFGDEEGDSDMGSDNFADDDLDFEGESDELGDMHGEHEGHMHHEHGEDDDLTEFEGESEGSSDLDLFGDSEGDLNDATFVAKDVQQAQELSKNLKADDKLEVKAFDLSSKAGRSAYRAKLAAETVEFSDMLGEAHPQGGFTTHLDEKAQGDLAHVEDLKETHKAMMEVAKASPKVRKEAAVIHQLVSEGKLDASDLDSLVSEGLDAETVKYYRAYYGQVDGGSEFAKALTKEAMEAKVAAEQEVYRVKLARAYELAYQMVDCGLCLNDREAVSSQVEEIMKFNDDSFESLKRVIARHQSAGLAKTASAVPQVGLIGASDVTSQVQSEDLITQLSAAFAKSTRKMF